MEFWGVEVKPGVPLKVQPGDKMLLHLSQASLGESKNKGNDSVLLFLNVDGKKLVVGTLSPEKQTDIAYDLVFEKEFELSHNWKNGSVYFCGYKTDYNNDTDEEDSEDSEEDIPIVAKENGKPEPKDAGKASSSAAKAKVKIAEPSKVEKAKEVEDSDDSDDEDEDSEDEDSEDGSEEDESDDEQMAASSDDSDDEDESSDDEDEATPKKAEQGKKRPAESATKTPTEKKAKLITPQKTGADGKKSTGGHTATPHPAKKAGKTPANSEKSKQQTPKSAGSQVSCNSCSKTFNSEKGLESHTKAKHSAAK